ncbi:MAG: class I SAM-dependent methyltransferase [Proteobacteria bacterium]|nr:class I SAM-dependent methyltransferase [Pseudomonadota bacterium]
MNKVLKFFKPDVGKKNEQTREVWLEKTLKAIPAGSRTLDSGAGTQQYQRFCQHLKYVSQDFAKYDGTGDSTALQIDNFDYGDLDIVSDISAIPEPDLSFDAIMCTEVLEHVPDPIAAIKEFSRLIKPNGYLLITAPFCSLTHFSPYHFSSGFNSHWYKKHLPEHNFKIVEITPNGNFFDYVAQEIGRTDSIAKRYSGKKMRLYERVAQQVLKIMLQRFSKHDSGSEELLCYGYHVLAKKND